MELNILFWIILLAVLGFYFYQKNNNKPWKKLLGGLLILIGAFIICPIPDPSDTIGFTIFSAIKGIDLNLNNLSVYFIEYTLMTLFLGGILILFGMNLLNLSLKKVWKKIDPGKYKIALFVSVLAVLVVALLDIWSAQSGIFGSLFDYTHGSFGVDWFPLFFKFVLVIFAIPAICYYFFVHKDLSESIGLFIFSTIIYFGGLADLFYFIFLKIPIPSELPWLLSSPFINFISTKLLGYATVTNISLLVSIAVSFVIAWGVAWVMKEKF